MISLFDLLTVFCRHNYYGSFGRSSISKPCSVSIRSVVLGNGASSARLMWLPPMQFIALLLKLIVKVILLYVKHENTGLMLLNMQKGTPVKADVKMPFTGVGAW